MLDNLVHCRIYYVANSFFSTGWLFGLFDWIFEKVADFLGSIFIAFITWLLFPIFVTIIFCFYLEKTATIVENKHYPYLPNVRFQSLKEVISITLKFTTITIVVNFITLPIYLIFSFLGPFNLLIFYSVNGYLIGREYCELVLYRRAAPSKALLIIKTFRFEIFVSGVIITFLMTIPILNLVAPIIATATMVHLIQVWENKLNKS